MMMGNGLFLFGKQRWYGILWLFWLVLIQLFFFMFILWGLGCVLQGLFEWWVCMIVIGFLRSCLCSVVIVDLLCVGSVWIVLRIFMLEIMWLNVVQFWLFGCWLVLLVLSDGLFFRLMKNFEFVVFGLRCVQVMMLCLLCNLVVLVVLCVIGVRRLGVFVFLLSSEVFCRFFWRIWLVCWLVVLCFVFMV